MVVKHSLMDSTVAVSVIFNTQEDGSYLIYINLYDPSPCEIYMRKFSLSAHNGVKLIV
jgi:hypothetical protein